MAQSLVEIALKKTITFIDQKRELENTDTERDLVKPARKKTLEYIERIRLLQGGKGVMTQVDHERL